jgi:hypothetical protein
MPNRFVPEVRWFQGKPHAVMIFDADECEAVGHYFPSHDLGGQEFFDAAEHLRQLEDNKDTEN